MILLFFLAAPSGPKEKLGELSPSTFFGVLLYRSWAYNAAPHRQTDSVAIQSIIAVHASCWVGLKVTFTAEFLDMLAGVKKRVLS